MNGSRPSITSEVLGFSIVNFRTELLVDFALTGNKVCIINTLNPHSYVLQKSDSLFRNALLNSSFLIPDGIGFVLAAKILSGENLERIAGYDLFVETLSQLDYSCGRIFFLGSTNEVLQLIANRLEREYPNIEVEFHSPSFSDDFDDNEIESFALKIRNFSPDVVFVGLTAPKQEKLIALLVNFVEPKMISGIGAVFDFYAGTISRPSNILIKLHLEWLGRLLHEPKRMWKRNFISTPKFVFDVICQKLKSISLLRRE